MRSEGRRFKPGQSGNPFGRPKKGQEKGHRPLTVKEKVDRHQAAKLARFYTRDAIDTLKAIMVNPRYRPRDRIEAARILFERGYGMLPRARTTE